MVTTQGFLNFTIGTCIKQQKAFTSLREVSEKCKRYFNSARGWERVFRKSQKKSVTPTELGSKGSILVISQDEKYWQHWRKTHCTLHPFPISSAQSQSGRGPTVGLSLPSASQTWGSSKPVPLQGPPLTALCSASSNIPTFPSLCSICPNLGISSFLQVQRREIFLPSLPFLYNPPTLPPGSGVNSGEKHNLDWAVVFIRRISFWAESLKRDKYT